MSESCIYSEENQSTKSRQSRLKSLDRFLQLGYLQIILQRHHTPGYTSQCNPLWISKGSLSTSTRIINNMRWSYQICSNIGRGLDPFFFSFFQCVHPDCWVVSSPSLRGTGVEAPRVVEHIDIFKLKLTSSMDGSILKIFLGSVFVCNPVHVNCKEP